jgi:hypothetical protein
LASSSREAEYKRQARDRNKDYVRDLKEKTPCADCGEIYHYSQMDFDHVDGKKKHNIARYANSAVSIKTIKDEIAKCQVVCANCHRLRTWERLNGWYNKDYGKLNEYES